MPLTERQRKTAKHIVELFSGHEKTNISFEEFKIINKGLANILVNDPSLIQDQERVCQMHQSLMELEEDYWGRGITDIEETLRGKNDEELDKLTEKLNLATGAISFLDQYKNET